LAARNWSPHTRTYYEEIAMTDYAQVVYEYIHTLGNVGDEVRTEIWLYLSKKFELTPAEATRARRRAMQELTNRG
jgi:hypothetical protein